LLGGRNDAGAFPPLARHGFINPFTPGCTTKFTIQAVIHAAFVVTNLIPIVFLPKLVS